MDQEIDELKAEVEELKQITADTNRVVRGMRRSQRWHTLFQIVWWLSVLGITGAAYYYYVQPYVQQILDSYNNAKGFEVQVQDFFAKFGKQGQ